MNLHTFCAEYFKSCIENQICDNPDKDGWGRGTVSEVRARVRQVPIWNRG